MFVVCIVVVVEIIVIIINIILIGKLVGFKLKLKERMVSFKLLNIFKLILFMCVFIKI